MFQNLYKILKKKCCPITTCIEIHVADISVLPISKKTEICPIIITNLENTFQMSWKSVDKHIIGIK